jgi:hypothetical protein
MQRIFQTSLTPEQYVEQDPHKRARSPDNCLNCGRGGRRGVHSPAREMAGPTDDLHPALRHCILTACRKRWKDASRRSNARLPN